MKGLVIGLLFLFGYMLTGATVALLTPDNILEYRWARSYTEFMAYLIHGIAVIGQRTPVPATQFIAAVMNLVAMIISFVLFKGVSLSATIDKYVA